MSESIVVALISSGIMGVVSVVSTIMTSKKSTDVLAERVNSLKDEVQKHNGFGDRINTVEKDVGILYNNQKHLAEKIKTIGGAK